MKAAVITGAASGIGKAFAEHLSAPDYDYEELWLLDLKHEALESFASSLPINTRLFALDLREEESYAGIKEALDQDQPQIGMLVNCAGFGTIGWFSETDMQKQLDMIDVNCKALTALTYLCIPFLTKGAKVLNMSSGAALMPQPRFAVYAATKAYVLSFSRAIGAVLKRKGVRVCAVCAGPVNTNFYKTAVKQKDYQNETKDLKMQTPEDIVRIAMRDAERGKDVCYPSTFMRFTAFLTKIAPISALLSYVMKASIQRYGPPMSDKEVSKG